MRLMDADAFFMKAVKVSYPVKHGCNDYEKGLTLTGIAQLLDEQPALTWRTDNPPFEGEYIVTIQNAKSATTLHYSEEQNEWFDENGEAYNVVAWMELPAAYGRKK